MLKFIRSLFMRKPAPIPAPYICRDNGTGQTIASGSLSDMQAFQLAFGNCGVYPNA